MTTIVAGRYFPATVRFPDGTTWRRVLVILAQGGEHAGLHVWQKPDAVADYHAPIDWGRTVLPARWRARNGVDIHTDDGLVTVTAGGGCSCGALARYAGPHWASTVRARA